MSEADEQKSREMKVTDRRMFTPDGELREEYRDVVGRSEAAATEVEPSPEPPRTPPPAQPPHAAPEPAAGERGAPVELPGTPPGLGPAFYDLVAVLAEPVPLYLGDAPLPDGRSAENIEAARFHIDLLDVLRQKTAGNLTAQESAVLEDVLYRLRMRYVQKRG